MITSDEESLTGKLTVNSTLTIIKDREQLTQDSLELDP